MRAIIVKNLCDRMRAYDDLIEQIDAADLTGTLAVAKNKTVKEHLWCIVGARESYANAIQLGQWQGFNCSMKSYGRADFVHALSSTSEGVLSAINAVSEWTTPREELLAALSEHEVMHEGQIIRLMYGLGKSLPRSWRWA